MPSCKAKKQRSSKRLNQHCSKRRNSKRRNSKRQSKRRSSNRHNLTERVTKTHYAGHVNKELQAQIYDHKTLIASLKKAITKRDSEITEIEMDIDQQRRNDSESSEVYEYHQDPNSISSSSNFVRLENLTSWQKQENFRLKDLQKELERLENRQHNEELASVNRDEV